MMQAHVSNKKKEEVILIANLLKKYSIIGIVNLSNLPAAQLRKMRAQLKESVLVRVTKKRLVKLAFNSIKGSKNLDELEKYLNNIIPGLIFTNQDPFKLSKILKRSKTSAPAKPGQIAPNDITVPAGPTEFPPGPIIGELGQIGILAGVENGKVAVKKDTTVVKTGDVISAKMAEVLGKLGYQPMEIGLNLVAVYDNGLIFTKSILDVDEKAYIQLLKQSHADSLALALSIGYVNKDTINLLLAKANAEANSLSDKANLLTSNAAAEKITEAETEALAVKDQVPEAVAEEIKEEKPAKTREDIKKLNMQKAQYTEEESKKAQDFINALKDKAVKK